jgi:preprotein translocase subunit SecA
MSEGSRSANPLRLPGLRSYPERRDTVQGWRRSVSGGVLAMAQKALAPRRESQLDKFVSSVDRLAGELQGLNRQGIADKAEELRAELVRRGFEDEPVAQAFALVRQAAAETIGLTHYEVQLRAGYAMLRGMVAELETGEGKTLTATLAAATAALSGVHVHVITVNDYLARRDRDLMSAVYEALGLTVGLVVSGLGQEQRREAYRADITYCTNKEAAFDYLRDRMVLENGSSTLRIKLARLFYPDAANAGPVMRGLQFAIVDEADSILIDEARTPLIISERTDPDAEQRQAQESLRLAESLREGDHYSYQGIHRQIALSNAGEQVLRERSGHLPGVWKSRLFREEQARNALAALHVFNRDQHYLVRDDKIEIIDENTGRVMPDRSWGEGIHQMIEVKEGCTVTGQTVPLAQMTYQRFFRRYRSLAGMTGTATEARAELWSVYRLPVLRVATHRPLARCYQQPVVYATSDEKWRKIVQRTRQLSRAGIPVLIGTRSVSSSEMASDYLAAAGVEHRVLNAAQDAHEAEIVAQAGRAGQVTVATNMAGRGVDIRLEEDVIERGGLHIIMSERHDSGRIDRQLFGRCARQGEPGHVEIFLSLEDSLLTDSGLALPKAGGANVPGTTIFDRAQRKMEHRYRQVRRELMRRDEQAGTVLAFAGTLE